MLLFGVGCLFFFVAVLSVDVSGECNGGCKEPTLLYADLDCKPVHSAAASDNECCPSEYDCSHIDKRATENKEGCYFHGKLYKEDEHIDDQDIYANCKINCKCRKKPSGNWGFTCAVLDCPEWLGYAPKNKECHFKYELDKCCMVGEICRIDKI